MGAHQPKLPESPEMISSSTNRIAPELAIEKKPNECNLHPLSAAQMIFFSKCIMIDHIPEDVFNYFKFTFIRRIYELVWDMNYCNMQACTVDPSRKRIAVHASGWQCSVLGSIPNCPSFRVQIMEVNSVAIGYAPREGFQPSMPTMFSKGLYLYTGNNLYYGGMDQSIEAHTRDYQYRFRENLNYKSGAIIEVKLDLVERTIRFINQGIDLGIAYSNISLDQDLYPAVSCYGPIEIQLL